LPGETTTQVERELREVIGDEAELRMLVARDPFEIDGDHGFVRLVASCAGDPEVVGVSYWADSGLIAGAGIPTVLFGPLGEGAHAVEEWVDLASVERVRDVCLAVASEWCA
jgi:acetylornithine deacetylase